MFFSPFECLIGRSVKEPIISEKVRFFVDLKNLEHTRQTFHERKENNGRYFWLFDKQKFLVWYHNYYLKIDHSVIQHRGEQILFFGPNTNTNNIRNQNFDQIRIRIIFVFSEWANTNTNNIRAQIFGRIRIRIIFLFFRMSEYKYE